MKLAIVGKVAYFDRYTGLIRLLDSKIHFTVIPPTIRGVTLNLQHTLPPSAASQTN